MQYWLVSSIYLIGLTVAAPLSSKTSLRSRDIDDVSVNDEPYAILVPRMQPQQPPNTGDQNRAGRSGNSRRRTGAPQRRPPAQDGAGASQAGASRGRASRGGRGRGGPAPRSGGISRDYWRPGVPSSGRNTPSTSEGGEVGGAPPPGLRIAPDGSQAPQIQNQPQPNPQQGRDGAGNLLRLIQGGRETETPPIPPSTHSRPQTPNPQRQSPPGFPTPQHRSETPNPQNQPSLHSSASQSRSQTPNPERQPTLDVPTLQSGSQSSHTRGAPPPGSQTPQDRSQSPRVQPPPPHPPLLGSRMPQGGSQSPRAQSQSQSQSQPLPPPSSQMPLVGPQSPLPQSPLPESPRPPGPRMAETNPQSLPIQSYHPPLTQGTQQAPAQGHAPQGYMQAQYAPPQIGGQMYPVQQLAFTGPPANQGYYLRGRHPLIQGSYPPVQRGIGDLSPTGVSAGGSSSQSLQGGPQARHQGIPPTQAWYPPSQHGRQQAHPYGTAREAAQADHTSMNRPPLAHPGPGGSDRTPHYPQSNPRAVPQASSGQTPPSMPQSNPQPAPQGPMGVLGSRPTQRGGVGMLGPLATSHGSRMSDRHSAQQASIVPHGPLFPQLDVSQVREREQIGSSIKTSRKSMDDTVFDVNQEHTNTVKMSSYSPGELEVKAEGPNREKYERDSPTDGVITKQVSSRAGTVVTGSHTSLGPAHPARLSRSSAKSVGGAVNTVLWPDQGTRGGQIHKFRDGEMTESKYLTGNQPLSAHSPAIRGVEVKHEAVLWGTGGHYCNAGTHSC